MKVTILLFIVSSVQAFSLHPLGEIPYTTRVDHLPLSLEAPRKGRLDEEINPRTLAEIKDLVQSVKNPDTLANILARRIENVKTEVAEELAKMKAEIAEELAKMKAEIRNLTMANGQLKTEKELLECGMWTIKACTAMEEFEEFGNGANMTLTEVEKKRVAGNYLEKQRLRREKKYNWIFENRTDEMRVKLLKDNVESRTLYPRTTQEYSYGAAWAYRHVCDYIHLFLSAGITAPLNLRIINDQPSRGALEAFLATKFGDSNAKLEKCLIRK